MRRHATTVRLANEVAAFWVRRARESRWWEDVVEIIISEVYSIRQVRNHFHKYRRIALLAGAHTARRLARLADDVGLRIGFAAMMNWVARVVLGVRYPAYPLPFSSKPTPWAKPRVSLSRCTKLT